MSEKYKFLDPDGIYFTTSTIVHWIDLFTRKELKHIVIKSLEHCQEEKGLNVHAWCLMPSHLHLMISAQNSLSTIIRDFKKYTAREVVYTLNKINESRKEWLIRAFEKSANKIKRNSKYKVWQDGNHPIHLDSNKLIEEKLDYIHRNPVDPKFVDEPEYYWYSSARDYAGSQGMLKIDLID